MHARPRQLARRECRPYRDAYMRRRQGGVVFTKAIEYTDFSLAEITLYFMNKTILLPSEY